MKLSEKLEELQKQAPCYIYLAEDGDKYKCADCGGRFWGREMVKYFLPNGKSGTCCYECLDPEWVKGAKQILDLL